MADRMPVSQRPVQAAVLAVLAEIEAATRKFPRWPTDPLHASGVVMEEAGELAKAVLQAVYEPHKSTPEDVREEAVQTAAMAIRFIVSMDTYAWERSPSHTQNAVKDSPAGISGAASETLDVRPAAGLSVDGSTQEPRA